MNIFTPMHFGGLEGVGWGAAYARNLKLCIINRESLFSLISRVWPCAKWSIVLPARNDTLIFHPERWRRIKIGGWGGGGRGHHRWGSETLIACPQIAFIVVFIALFFIKSLIQIFFRNLFLEGKVESVNTQRKILFIHKTAVAAARRRLQDKEKVSADGKRG